MTNGDEPPTAPSGADPHPTRTVGPAAGGAALDRRVGPYRILKELGQGGMGTVYLAVRADEQFTKRVALKVIRSGSDSAEVVRQFKRERQILASLDHPNIARLLDGGTTDDGLPYFVMEHIEGEQILHYCDSRSLGVGERLKLFQSVCSAVQYAHRNLVVHRDIKPGNILVTGDGVPKLLDFGIAKLLNPELSGDAPTATGVAMTPDYASPEQVRGGRITTATDVYSLGVVLYELLTGRQPYRLASRQPLDVLRAVSEQEAEVASTALDRAETVRSAEGQATATALDGAARKGESSQERLKRRLRGDLDNILMMALRKEPQRRYASVEALSDDLRRHLEGLPVLARRPTLGYRAGRFAKRNAVAVAAAAVVLVLLVGFAVAMAVQSARVSRERDVAQRERATAQRERETAQRERETAQRVSGFLVDLFKVSDPSQARGSTVTAREVLEKGATKIASELKDQPEVRATLMDTMGAVYSNLGLYDRAVPLLQEGLATRRATLGADHLDVATSLNNLASVQWAKGDRENAEALHREALALRRKLLGQEHALVASSLNNLANVLYDKGDYAGAEALYREALAMRRKLLGDEHPHVAINLNNLANVLYERGDYAGAEVLYREALGMARKLLGNEHPDVAFSLYNLANAVAMGGDLAGGATLHREALALRRKLLGDAHPFVAYSLARLAETLCRARDPEGEARAREAVQILAGALPAGHADIAEAESVLGSCVALTGRYPQAETLLQASYSVLQAKRGEGSLEARDARARIVRLYEAWGKPDKAARYRTALAAPTPDGRH